MSVEQTRIYELGLYAEDLDPDEVMVSVDHSSWSRPKRFPLSSLGSAGLKSSTLSQHIESGRITGLTNHYVTHDFEAAFAEIPIGRENLYVYKSETLPDGKVIDQKLEPYNVEVTTSGFSLYIQSQHALSGIVIEYLFI